MHPVQPVVFVGEVARFRENKIVSFLLDNGRALQIVDMNTLAHLKFKREDRVQFAQLIGYSVSGFGDLSYVQNSDYDSPASEVDRLIEANERTTVPPHPLQYVPNKIVCYLLEHAGYSIDDLAKMDFSDEDRVQFAQLIGSTVCQTSDKQK